MEWIILFFLALSIYLYCLLGGADFGVGVHELFFNGKRKRQHEEIVKEAMGPVWEANHMWLIIVVVILFVGFPRIYAQASTYLHIPITLMLVGIILRGCAFTFRHYDSVEDGSRKYYSIVFSISSLLTPIMLGVIIGSLMLGKIPPQIDTYLSTYINPWFNIFSLSVGLFVLSIFIFISAVFMIGEHSIGDFKDQYITHAKISYMTMILMGAIVFVAAEIDGLSLAHQFLSHPLALGAMIMATLLHTIMWKLFSIAHAWRLRLVTGLQLLLIITAWLGVIYPNALFYADGTALSFLDNISPQKTQNMLGYALLIGSVIFLPVLFYLFYIFKHSKE